MLLAHKGSGILFSELTEKNWCEDLVAHYETIPGLAFFDVDISLTKEAMDHVDDIVKLVFQVEHEEDIYDG